MNKNARSGENFQYDVCLSFAGEDRSYVARVADALNRSGVRVFYDRYERAELWGKELYSHLDYVYRHAARYCVVFVSTRYSSKLWTNHERKSAQARAFGENREYILPARFDDTDVPGLLETVGYVDLRQLKPKQLAELILEKLGPRQRSNFLPPVVDRLFKRVRAVTSKEKERVSKIAYSFFEAFQRMSADERKVISAIFLNGCPADLPRNSHINVDLLRRVTGFPVAKINKLVTGLRSLGFYSRPRVENGGDVVEIVFDPLSVTLESNGNETGIVVEMIEGMGENLCEQCSRKALLQADFSQLASVTTVKEIHRKRKRRNHKP
jgi:hypothetical protein